MTDRVHLERMSKELADNGKLIEAGWIGLRLAAVPDDAPKVQLQEMRQAFFAGAAHLFSSMMSIMEPGEDPTDADLSRMDLINKELAAFSKELEQTVRQRKHQQPPPASQEIEAQYREMMNKERAVLSEEFERIARRRQQRQAAERLGDQPIEAQYREKMNRVAGILDAFFNGDAVERKVGFVLLVFEFGEDVAGRCNFISNGNRRDIVALFKEMIARFEGQPEMKGRA